MYIQACTNVNTSIRYIFRQVLLLTCAALTCYIVNRENVNDMLMESRIYIQTL